MIQTLDVIVKSAEVIPSADLAASARGGLKEFKSREKDKVKGAAAKVAPSATAPKKPATRPPGIGWGDGEPSAAGLEKMKRSAWAGEYLKHAARR